MGMGQAPSTLPQLRGGGGTSLLATGGQASWDGTDLWEAPKPSAHVGSELSQWRAASIRERPGGDSGQGRVVAETGSQTHRDTLVPQGATAREGQSAGQPGRKLSGGSCGFQNIQRWPLRGPASSNTPVATSTPNMLNLAPNTTLPGKEPGSSERRLVLGEGVSQEHRTCQTVTGTRRRPHGPAEGHHQIKQ